MQPPTTSRCGQERKVGGEDPLQRSALETAANCKVTVEGTIACNTGLPAGAQGPMLGRFWPVRRSRRRTGALALQWMIQLQHSLSLKARQGCGASGGAAGAGGLGSRPLSTEQHGRGWEDSRVAGEPSAAACLLAAARLTEAGLLSKLYSWLLWIKSPLI